MDIRLEDASVSRFHAELVRRGPYVYVVDMGLSRNGTRVNGRPIARRVLEDGDVISFGSARGRLGGIPREEVDPEVELRRAVAPELTRREVDVLTSLCRPALSDEAFGLSGNVLRIAIMIFVMGFFNWPYLARIVRAEVLSLREREFVDAARALGAGPRWIIWRELMPNLMAPILVYATLLIPANIIFEAGLSALGIGLDPPAASWGQMMTDAVATVYTDPAYLIVPGMAVFITVLAFNLFGDGLRDALDPTAQ